MYRRRNRGHTLLELIAASTLVSIALTVTMSLIRDSVDLSEDTELRNMITTLCVSKLEERLARCATAATNWPSLRGVVTGNFSAEGFADIKFSAQHSDSVADGGIPAQLMTVSVLVWQDKNGDGTVNSGEPVVRLASKIANITAWEVP